MGCHSLGRESEHEIKAGPGERLGRCFIFLD